MEGVAKRYRQSPLLADMKLGELTPGCLVPAVRLKGPDLVAELALWGFENPFGSGLIINARSETVAEKPLFRQAFQTARLLLPAHAFYEWQVKESGGKQKIRFSHARQQLLFLAAVARPGVDTKGRAVMRFVVLTAPANDSVQPVHSRMPLLIDWEDIRAYLADEARALALIQAPAGPSLTAAAQAPADHISQEDPHDR